MKTRQTRRQSGFTLIEVAIVMTISMIAFTQFVNLGVMVMKKEGGERAGMKIAQVNAAVAAFINASQPAVATANHAGIAWLQDAATCPGGTGAAAFLPCSFDPWMGWGMTFIGTQITNNSPAAPTVKAETFVMPPREGTLMDQAVAGHVLNGAQNFRGIASQTEEKAVGYLGYKLQSLNVPVIVATVDTGVQAVPWLNRDGTNTMTGNLDMAGHDINGAGVVVAQTMTANDVLANHNVVAGNDVAAQKDVIAGGNVAAIKGISTQGAMTAGTDVTAGNNVVAAKDVQAGGDVTLTGSSYTDPATGVANQPISLASTTWAMSYVSNSPTGTTTNFVDKPICPAGKKPQIYMVPGQYSVGGVAEPIGGMDLIYIDHPTQWETSFILYTASHPTGYRPDTATALVMMSCQ